MLNGILVVDKPKDFTSHDVIGKILHKRRAAAEHRADGNAGKHHDRWCNAPHAGKAEDKKETVYEIADLAYHIMVLMVELGISVEDIRTELAGRHVIDHKVKQEKMV